MLCTMYIHTSAESESEWEAAIALESGDQQKSLPHFLWYSIRDPRHVASLIAVSVRCGNTAFVNPFPFPSPSPSPSQSPSPLQQHLPSLFCLMLSSRRCHRVVVSAVLSFQLNCRPVARICICICSCICSRSLQTLLLDSVLKVFNTHIYTHTYAHTNTYTHTHTLVHTLFCRFKHFSTFRNSKNSLL